MTVRDLPPIIILLLDSASTKHFSLYGHHRRTTPHLEEIAPETAVYRHCFSTAPWTVPSHVSLFTGLYPHEHRCNDVFVGMREDLLSLPEVLKEVGYRTFGVSSNLLVSRTLGFSRAFEEFYEMGTLFQNPRYLEARKLYIQAKPHLKSDWEKIKFSLKYILESRDFTFPLKKTIDKLYKKHLADITASTAFMSKRSLRLAKRLVQKCQADGGPFFLFINLMETHGVFNAPYPFNRQFQKIDSTVKKRLSAPGVDANLYEENPELRRERAEFLGLSLDQEILFTDSLIGDFYQFLRQQNLLDRVLLIITSDHGEGMGEHGLFGHSFAVYNELVHIPLVVKYPRDYGLTGDVTRLAQLNDLFATICQMTNVARPTPFSSHSLLEDTRDFALSALLDNRRGMDYLARRFTEFKVFSSMLPGHAWINSDLWKLIRWQDGARELYDLNQDPGEQHNLMAAPQHAAKAAAMESRMDDYLADGG